MKKGGNSNLQWCSLHRAAIHNDGEFRVQIRLRNATNNVTANCAFYSCYPAVLSARYRPQGGDPERPCISFTPLVAPTTAAPTEEEVFWLFDPLDEPLTLFDTNGPLGAFSGVTGDETGGAAFMLKKETVEGLGLLKRITGGLSAIIRSMTVVALSSFMVEEGQSRGWGFGNSSPGVWL